MLIKSKIFNATESMPKAYIISTSDSISSAADKAARYCGFLPQYFAAVRPFDVIFRKDRQYMYENCVGIRESSQYFLNYSQRTSEHGFTTSEMALVCSHREVLHRIASKICVNSIISNIIKFDFDFSRYDYEK